MDLSHFASLFMDANGPRDAAERTLRWLKEECSARSVALWRSEGERLVLELSLGVDGSSLEGAQGLWAQRGDTLLAGQPVTDAGRILIPARPDGTYIYLDGIDARGMNIALAAAGATVALQALRRGPGPMMRGRRVVGSNGLFRDELIATLRLHEWNLARVARVKGVTRKTIYDWLEKYDIPREKVRRS